MGVAHYPTDEKQRGYLISKIPSHHIDDTEEENHNPIIKLCKKLKSIDGIDEIAQALGQILPGLAGPVATASVLTVATPFVYLGLLGMKEEYQEACAEYNEILENRQNSDIKLLAMTANADKWREFLAKKLNLSMNDKSPGTNGTLGTLALNNVELDTFAYRLVESEILRNKEFVAALSRKYGWTGIVGMGGMFAGMLPATVSAGIGISREVGLASATALNAASILTIISSSAFLIGQVAMSVYATNKARQGKAIENLLNSHKAQFTKHATGKIKAATGHAIVEIIDRDLHFNNRCNIQYGGATVFGQAFMAAGTIASLTGAGAVVGIPLVAVGAPITVGAAIGRIVYNHKENHFKGAGSAYSDRRKIRTDLLHLLLHRQENKNVMAILETEFEFCSRQLACMKLYSLMRHLVHDSKYRKYTPAQKLTRLEEIVDTGKISFFKGTSLRGDVLDMVREIFRSDKENIRNFMGFAPAHANKLLLANIVNCAKNSEASVPAFYTNLDLEANREPLKELLALIGMEGTNIYKRVASCSYLAYDYDTLNEVLTPKLKDSLKFIRHDLADKFVHMSHIEELKVVIANESLLQKATHARDPYNFHTRRYIRNQSAGLLTSDRILGQKQTTHAGSYAQSLLSKDNRMAMHQ